ncbi:MAG: hypothetical protein V3U27_10760, partial [Candidatus Tectomicrobia bacterium]
MTANLHLLRREVAIVHQRAEALRTLATEQEFPYWGAQGMIMWGWALAAQGQAEEGLPHMHEGLAALQATGVESRRPWYLG